MNYFLLFTCAVCLILKQLSVMAFGVAPVISRSLLDRITLNRSIYKTQISVGSSQTGAELDGEMNKFFELAAESGSEKIRQMTPEERVERVIRGEYLENLIFEKRSELMSLEEDLMAGKDGVDATAVKSMRDKLNGLKIEYKDIVGANDLPLYFGRISDGMQ